MSQHFSRQARLAAAFLAIYILWGSTYLAVAINTRSSVSICGRPPCERDFQRQ
jgi:hypothetical protein